MCVDILERNLHSLPARSNRVTAGPAPTLLSSFAKAAHLASRSSPDFSWCWGGWWLVWTNSFSAGKQLTPLLSALWSDRQLLSSVSGHITVWGSVKERRGRARDASCLNLDAFYLCRTSAYLLGSKHNLSKPTVITENKRPDWTRVMW